MSNLSMQKSFNSGEWAPQLYSRVDMEKYRSGAALLRNFFVDYRGGASTRTGTQYVLQAYKSATRVRIIPFQASISVSYILEFGDHYIRFYNNGAPVLETAVNITGATQANPCVISAVNTYSPGDWVFIAGVGGMTQLNGNYYSVLAATGTTLTLGDLNGNPINSTGYGAYTSGGIAARVYTLTSPYAAADLDAIKYAQSVNSMILCNPNYAPQVLTLIAANNWTISAIAFGTSASQPSAPFLSTTLSSGSVTYSYVITAFDSQGDESIASTPSNLSGYQDLRNTYGSVSISWSAVAGAVSYNVYKSDVSYFGAVPAGVPYGYIGNVSGTSIIDSNIAADFSQTPPVGQNPFQGSAVQSITQGAAGTYTYVPAVYFSGGSPSATAIASAILGAQTATVNTAGTGYAVNDTITLGFGVIVVVASIGGGGTVATLKPFTSGGSRGSLTSGSAPATSAQTATSGGGTGFIAGLTWGVTQTIVNYGGQGYLSVPTISYSPAGATGTAVLSAAASVNPTVPGFFQQRMVLAAATIGPETMAFSQPGRYYNYNTSSPIQADDAIEVTLASGQLETIKSIVPTAPGLVVFTDKSSWLVTGGQLGSAISPSQIVANRQSYNGASDVPPILNNYDILYVEEKGSSVRDANYNYYAQVFTGQDISAIASHLLYGYKILDWSWAQAPFKVVWSIRNDGTLLSLTFAKEEDFVAWAHHDTNGSFVSIATVPEVLADGMIIDRVYVVVQRTVGGNTVQYIERFASRVLNGQASNAWCVDAGIQYSGSPANNFSGGQHLAGMVVTGLADGVVIPPFTMSADGTFTLPTPASVVTVGLGFVAQLQTLPLETGEPTTQSKQKKISGVTLRVVDTLGLSIGSSFTTLVSMKDLIVGNIGSMTNQMVTNLVTGDARTFVDPVWAEQGQFCVQQSLPLPATVTGVIPQITIGDTAR